MKHVLSSWRTLSSVAGRSWLLLLLAGVALVAALAAAYCSADSSMRNTFSNSAHSLPAALHAALLWKASIPVLSASCQPLPCAGG
jgi:hypothetical protein